ncbi:hypothetical protein R5R35_000956 [Gryllus longicercus]|uniref:Phosphatidylinositol N-acetylglucosaminyltransferase subunit H conserved domain-containing protein n=1 Tax=Gryllus longicercus TaxID=2509291 RepID=A0AAN9VM05_9ORTH
MSQTFHRKRKHIYCESVDGLKLSLSVHNSELPEMCSEFVVLNVSCPSLMRTVFSVIFLIVSLLLIYYVYFNIIVIFFGWIVLLYQVFKLFWSVQKETLLVIAPVGLQITTTFLCGYENSHFIPWYCIVDVIINEAISLQKVLFYLAVLVEHKSEKDTSRKIIPLFQFTRPRLKCLEQIYINIQRLFSVSRSNVS